MSTTIRLDPRTYGLLQSALTLLPQRVYFRVLRIALNAWGGVVKAKEKSLAKHGATGLLAKSPTVEVKIPDASFNAAHHGRQPYVRVGPSRNVVGPVVDGKRVSIRKATKHALAGGRVLTRRPSRYAHLVEKGIAGKKHIAPAPFVAPAAEAGRTAGMAALTAKLESGIAAEAAKLVKS